MEKAEQVKRLWKMQDTLIAISNNKLTLKEHLIKLKRKILSDALI
jgi:hypothetical protein